MKIVSFPIVTTDQKANEAVQGLCPMLCSDVGNIGSSAQVVSEYGVRNAIDNIIGDAASGIILGVGESIFKDYNISSPATMTFKTLLGNNPDRIIITDDSSGNLTIAYDGSEGDIVYYENFYVQGGSKQLSNTFYSLTGGAGYSDEIIPISANAFSELSGNSLLSADALYNWNNDIAVGKIGVKIPYDNAFDTADIIIGVGLSGDPYKLGYFKTKTQADIGLSGEWWPLTYSSGMMKNQYEYFTNNTSIYAYTTGTLVQGEFTLNIFYDQVLYIKNSIVPQFTLIVGGYHAGTDAGYHIEKLVYSTDIVILYSNELSDQRWQGGIVGDKSTYCYYAKGSENTPPSVPTNVYKIAYSTGINTDSGLNVTRAQYNPWPTTDLEYTYGYWINFSANYSDKINISSSIVSTLSVYMGKYCGATGQDTVRGYSIGGSQTAAPASKVVHTFIHSTNTLSSPTTVSSLPTSVSQECKMYNNIKAYVMYTTTFTTGYIYTYSSGTAAARTGFVGTSSLKYNNTGSSSNTHAYSIGGYYSTTYQTSINKISMSTDTENYTETANMIIGKGSSSTQNSF